MYILGLEDRELRSFEEFDVNSDVFEEISCICKRT
jgi:hypothetical protein